MADQDFTSKFCPGCNLSKPFDDWHKNKRSKDGFAFRCKSCAVALSQKWREGNRERHRAASNALTARYREASKTASPDLQKFCPRCHMHKEAADFFKKNDTFSGLSQYCKECTRAFDRARDKVKRRAIQAKGRLKNRELVNFRQREFYKSNKEIFLANNRKRKALLRGLSGSHSGRDVLRILKLQKYKCVYCKENIKRGYHVDHIMPLSLGGSNGADNIQMLCPTCNLRKRAAHPLTYANSLGMLL